MPATPQGDDLRLPPAVHDVLLAASRRRPLARGEALFHKGSLPDALFGVLAGTLRVSVVSAGGREAVIALLEPGHWFGEVSLFVGAERVYDTCALEDSEIAVIPAADFHQLVAARPDVHFALTRLVCFRLRHALAWIDDAILMPLPVRLAHRLLALDTGSGALAVSQEELAFMLGVSRQSINRQLGLWQDQGLVRTSYGRIELLDPTELARLTRT